MLKVFIRMLVGSIGESDLFKEIRELVEAIASSTLNGREKRDHVLGELSDVGRVGSMLIFNVLLELAVLWVKKSQ